MAQANAYFSSFMGDSSNEDEGPRRSLSGLSSEEDSDAPPTLAEIKQPEDDPTHPAFNGWKMPMRITEYADGTQDIKYHPLDGRQDVRAVDTRTEYHLQQQQGEPISVSTVLEGMLAKKPFVAELERLGSLTGEQLDAEIVQWMAQYHENKDKEPRGSDDANDEDDQEEEDKWAEVRAAAAEAKSGTPVSVHIAAIMHGQGLGGMSFTTKSALESCVIVEDDASIQRANDAATALQLPEARIDADAAGQEPMPHTLDDIKIEWNNWPIGTPVDNARMLAQDAARSMTAGDRAIASRFYAHSHQPIVFDEEDEDENEDDDDDDLPPLEDAPVDVRTRFYLDHMRVQATKHDVGAHERPELEPVPPCAGMFTYDLPETYHERKAAAKPASSSSSDDDDSGSWLNDDPHDGEMASRRFMPAPKPRGARVKREDWDKNHLGDDYDDAAEDFN